VFVTTGGHDVNGSARIALFANTLVLMALSASGKTIGAISAGQTLPVHLYDQAHVPAAVLYLAEGETTRLFEAAGIRLIWEQRAAEAPEDRGIDMSSATPPEPDERSYAVVRLTRRTPATTFPGALGFALPFARSGAHVSIFYERVEGLCRSVNAACYVVLGEAIAHELGHVLLRSSDHSTAGLMQARWNAATWQLASAGLLAFSRQEAERMNAGLRRMQARGRASGGR